MLYLHGDHLGSVSLSTDSAGNKASEQEFDPWGGVRSGGVSQTTGNYTGQQLDSTGLLYYHARYYDPGLARFVSADSIVPKSSSNLTVDFHENAFLSNVSKQNVTVVSSGFAFQSGKGEKTSGPSDPQNSNRYTYASNNPLKYTDSDGHTVYLTSKEAEILFWSLQQAAAYWKDKNTGKTTVASAAKFILDAASLISAPWKLAVAALIESKIIDVLLSLNDPAAILDFANRLQSVAMTPGADGTPQKWDRVSITTHCWLLWCTSHIINSDSFTLRESVEDSFMNNYIMSLNGSNQGYGATSGLCNGKGQTISVKDRKHVYGNDHEWEDAASYKYSAVSVNCSAQSAAVP